MNSCDWVNGKQGAAELSAIPCPPYPIAGPAVAAEIEEFNDNEDKFKDMFPKMVEWMQRLDKHATQHEDLEQKQ